MMMDKFCAALGAVALLAIAGAIAPAQAASCPAAFPAPSLATPPEPDDHAPCADALLALWAPDTEFAPGAEFHVVDTRYGRDADDKDNAFVSFQIASDAGRRLCGASSFPADMQIHFRRDPQAGWVEIDSRGGTDPQGCGSWTLWNEDDLSSILNRPDKDLPTSSVGIVHDIARGDPQRKAILDAVREANSDLNDQMPIVFVVDILRSDGHWAYFRGAVRRKDTLGPLPDTVWGECEQDPEEAVLEALLVQRNGRWAAVNANRCADDVFWTDDEANLVRALSGAE